MNIRCRRGTGEGRPSRNPGTQGVTVMSLQGFLFASYISDVDLNKAATQKGQQTQIRQVSRKACPLQQNDGEGDSQDGARLGNNNYFFPDKWRKKKKVSAESRLPPSLGWNEMHQPPHWDTGEWPVGSLYVIPTQLNEDSLVGSLDFHYHPAVNRPPLTRYEYLEAMWVPTTPTPATMNSPQ